MNLEGLEPVGDESEDGELRGGADESLGQVGVPAAIEAEEAAFAPHMPEGVDRARVVVLVTDGYALRRLRLQVRLYLYTIDAMCTKFCFFYLT